MQNYGEQSPSLKRKRRKALRLHFRLGLCFLIVVGCETGCGSKQLNDPMRGAYAPPKQIEQASGSSNASQATSGPIPAMPSTYTATSTAPMAVGETATPEAPRDLRMAGSSITSPSVPTAAARGAAPAVTVGNPEAAPAASAANLTKPPNPPLAGSAANIRTYEEAQHFLTQQRVSWQRLDMEDGQWKFECGVPNPSNPQINRHYATSRPFPDPLSAIREVITQIEKKGS